MFLRYLPLLVMVLGMYAFAGHNIISRMRNPILMRESRTQWVREAMAAGG